MGLVEVLVSIQSMSRRVFRVVRRGATLLEPAPAAASIVPTLTKCPQHAARVKVVVAGSTALTGTVTISGSLGGAPQTEDLTVDGPIANGKWVGRTCKLFDCVTAISTLGLADEVPPPLVSARFVGDGGNPVPANCEIADCVLGHLEQQGRGSWPNRTSGTHEVSNDWIAHDDIYGFRPRRGDLYVEQRPNDLGALVDFKIWEVVGNPEHLGALRSVHWELDVVEANSQDLTVVAA